MAMSSITRKPKITPELIARLILRRSVLGESDKAICERLEIDPFDFQDLVAEYEIHKKPGPVFTPLGKLWREVQWRVEEFGSERKQLDVLDRLNDYLKREGKKTK